jgi:hypothetical protein
MRVGLARAEASARTYPECAAISRAWRHQIMLEEQPSPAATWLHHASIGLNNGAGQDVGRPQTDTLITPTQSDQRSLSTS